MSQFAKKYLGQHWLSDLPTLRAVANAAEVSGQDIVLEIGPGKGSLTRVLSEQAAKVIAIEKDQELAKELQVAFAASNVEVVSGDIVTFNLMGLPANYKVAANIPYYLTSKLLKSLLESSNPPAIMALLVQKEVAERITASPGAMSVLAFSVQYYAEPELIQIVDRHLFIPVPKVDSAIIRLARRPQPLFEADSKKLFRLVKAAFSERRKMIKNALAGGLHLSIETVEELLQKAEIPITARAQDLSMADWQSLYTLSKTILR